MTRDENGLRVKVKEALKDKAHLSWVESHSTSPGVPDLNYCIDGVEGWLELKSGSFDVKASQVRWFEDRVAKGGWPLFLIEMGGIFMLVPGSKACRLKISNDYTAVSAMAVILTGGLSSPEFAKLLKEPRGIYEDDK